MNGHAFEVIGVSKSFGSVVALDGIDLSASPGSVLGLLGPNGAGKTTAVRILTTTLRPDRGEARVLGIDVAKAPEQVRARIGLAGQFAAVDENLTGRENLRLIGKLTHVRRALVDERSDELLVRFGLVDAADRPVRTYSGGMRRRLDLSAALVHRPPVLFLDEPTTGLDPVSRTDLWAVIEDLVASGTTVLLTTQYLEEADRLADQIVVIDHGQVIASGTPSELKGRLGATVIEIGMADEAGAASVEAALGDLGGRPPEHDGTVARLTVDDGPRALARIMRRLDEADIEVTTLAVREPSLDDVFLSLTGHRAEQSDAVDGQP